MTTGSVTRGSKTAGGHYFSKTWNGTDGKYDAVHRIKWNQYTVSVDTADIVPATTTPANIITPVFGVSYTWTADDELQLLSRLADAARGHSFNLGVAIGEGRETIDLLVGTASRFYRSLRALKHGHFGNAARELGITAPRRHLPARRSTRMLTDKDISSQWLELQYGWLPLLGDIHESAKAFSAIADKQRRLTFSVSHKVEKSYQLWSGGTCVLQSWTESRRKKYVVTMSEPLGARASLGLVDPYSVAWELTPFSFVADWFIPVGTYLDALAVIPRLNATYKPSLRYRKTGTMVYRTLSGCGYISDIYWSGAKTSVDSIIFTRSPETSITVPFPQFHIEDSLRSNRVWNAIALLHQFVR